MTDIKPSKPFNIYEMDFLQDPEQAALYLAEAYEESEVMFQQALHDVAKAQPGGITKAAKDAGLSRTNLYKSLSKTGRPNMQTITKMVDALGFKMRVSFEPKAM